MKLIFTSIFFLLSIFTFAQSSTHIFVFDIKKLNSDTLIYSKYENITSENEGYNNQPNFSKNGNSILFTAIKKEEQADIYQYNLLSKKTKQVTFTKTSEFSPTQIKKSPKFSMVKVEDDGTQRLWIDGLNNNIESLIMSKVKGIGYHTWLNNNKLALFIVGKPHELHIANVRKNESYKIAENIGSAVHKKEKNIFGFMDFTDSTNCLIKEYYLKTEMFDTVCNCIKDSEYFIYLKNGNILSGIGKSLYQFNRVKKQWKLIADFSEIENFNFYRLAINDMETKLALVTR